MTDEKPVVSVASKRKNCATRNARRKVKKTCTKQRAHHLDQCFKPSCPFNLLNGSKFHWIAPDLSPLKLHLVESCIFECVGADKVLCDLASGRYTPEQSCISCGSPVFYKKISHGEFSHVAIFLQIVTQNDFRNIAYFNQIRVSDSSVRLGVPQAMSIDAQWCLAFTHGVGVEHLPQNEMLMAGPIAADYKSKNFPQSGNWKLPSATIPSATGTLTNAARSLFKISARVAACKCRLETKVLESTKTNVSLLRKAVRDQHFAAIGMSPTTPISRVCGLQSHINAITCTQQTFSGTVP